MLPKTLVHDAKRRLRLVMELIEQEWCRQQTHGAGKPHSNEELHHENCRPLCPSLNDKPTICNACAGHVCLSSITIPYSQWPADKVAIGAGAPGVPVSPKRFPLDREKSGNTLGKSVPALARVTRCLTPGVAQSLHFRIHVP